MDNTPTDLLPAKWETGFIAQQDQAHLGVSLSMEKKSKYLLLASILCLIGGIIVSTDLINPASLPSIHVLLPLGVILAGAALVTQLLERDSRWAVEDQRRTLERAGIQVPPSETPTKQGAILAQ